MNEDRVWMERNAIPFALGMLTDEDEARFRESAHDGFADLLDADDRSAAGHVPAALVARWGTAGRSLSDNERTLVEEHLRGCPTCQEDLQLVGFAVPGPEPARIGGWNWRPWLGGAVLGAAATLAFVMVTPRPSPVAQGQYVEVISPRAVRGPDTPLYLLDAHVNAFLLAVPLPGDLEAGTRLVLRAPDGGTVLDRPVDTAPSTQVLVLANRGFATGEYKVEIRLPGRAGVRDLGRFLIGRPE